MSRTVLLVLVLRLAIIVAHDGDGVAAPLASASRHHLGAQKQLFVVTIGKTNPLKFPVFANASAASQGARICAIVGMGPVECNTLQVRMAGQYAVAPLASLRVEWCV